MPKVSSMNSLDLTGISISISSGKILVSLLSLSSGYIEVRVMTDLTI